MKKEEILLTWTINWLTCQMLHKIILYAQWNTSVFKVTGHLLTLYKHLIHMSVWISQNLHLKNKSSTTSTASSSDVNTAGRVSAQEVKKYSQPIRVKEVYMSTILPPLIDKPTASGVSKFSSLKRFAS